MKDHDVDLVLAGAVDRSVEPETDDEDLPVHDEPDKRKEFLFPGLGIKIDSKHSSSTIAAKLF